MLLDRERAHRLAKEAGLDALIAASPENVHYASNLADPYTHVVRSNLSFAVLPVDGEPVLVVNDAEKELARRDSWIDEHVYYGSGIYVERDRAIDTADSPTTALQAALEARDIANGTLGVDVQQLLLPQYRAMETALDARIRDCTDLFYKLRSVKTDEELKRLERAAQATAVGIRAFFDAVRPGICELELKRIVQRAVAADGADVYGHHPGHMTLAAGPGSATPISPPSGYELETRDVARMDFGAIYQGYTSDISRVGTVGAPLDDVRERYTTLRAAQREMLDQVQPGTTAAEVFEAGHQYVREHRHPGFDRDVLGHGIGMENHEPPYIAPGNDRELEPGMVLAIEIPYYVEGAFGFDVEDVCVVTDEGHELLTDLSHDLFVCD